MADPPLSPNSQLAEDCFGASENEEEEFVVSPEQHSYSEPVRSPCVTPTPSQLAGGFIPPPPSDSQPPGGQLPKKPPKKRKTATIDADFAKESVEAYEQHKRRRKDLKAKIKSSSTSELKGGKDKQQQPVPSPPPHNQYGHTAPAPHPYYPGTVPPPPPRHWGSGAPYGGPQGHPYYSYPYAGYSQEMPHHATYPPKEMPLWSSHWQHSHWSPQHGYGYAPPMERTWQYSHPQQQGWFIN